MTDSLYEKYGGFPAVNSVVQDFYDRILECEILDQYFEDVDMPALIAHQTQFLCKVLGGPDNYEGRSLKGAHKGLKITKEAFGEVARCLTEALTEAGVEDADVQSVLSIVASTEPDIVEEAA